MAPGKDLISSLLIASEKAARVARICRQNEHLLSLLVQEKKDDEKNKRFVKDFKTLADVLVQQLISYDLEKEFPELKNRIYGEESNSFTNTIGESVTINLNEDKTNTINLLSKVLDDDEQAANLLADCIHSQISLKDVPISSLPSECDELILEELALWIDPIDSTAEYINGENTSNYVNDTVHIALNGLNCVTVLIGVFNKSNGAPVIGVVNQPFYKLENQKWQGRCFWGTSLNNHNLSSVASLTSITKSENIIAVSSSENEENKKKLLQAGFKLISPAGAGYKILCVILGQVDAYVLSYGTTYYWDTCGCHAILNSLNGNIWNFEEAVRNESLVSVFYQEKNRSNSIELYSNKCGIIASKNSDLTRKIMMILKQN